MKFLDLHAQYTTIQRDIDRAIRRVFQSCAFIGGEEVEQFEQDMRTYCKVRHAISLNSGTDALFLALKALGIGKGDEVITTPFTFIATAGTIAQTGATPVFADIDPATFNIDSKEIEKKITPRTKAIMPVHLFGRMADMETVMRIAKKRKLYVVEDAAQAVGAKSKKMAGAFGDAGCLSFFPSKNLGAYGDGGMVVTSSAKLAEQVRLLKNHGSSKKEKYYNLVIGTNSRLDALQAAFLRVKLKHLHSWSKARREKAAYYNKGLAGIANIQTPEIPAQGEHIFHQYTMRVQKGARDALALYLKNKDIPTMIYYPLPLHLQPALAFLKYRKGDFPHAERASQEALSLPLYPEITKKEQDAIIKEIKLFFK